MSQDYMFLHRVLRYIASLALYSFFTEVRIIGEQNVPRNGPIIVVATHHNMMLDPVVLSAAFPYQRILHYWSKASLYKNPIVRYILVSTGNIPVDRKSKDRQSLFSGTFDALSKSQAVALFPEGTSYTEPRIMQVKDGAAWSALEFTKWLKDHPDKAPKEGEGVKIVPAAIVYTNKSKYRSNAIMEFGAPISLDAYQAQFNSLEEGAARAAVKRLTRDIEAELVAATVNAPDWDTLYAARMARDILWEADRSIPLDDFVSISQTLVDVFSTPNVTPNLVSTRRTLLEYYSLLQSTQLTNSVLSALPLPRDLHPDTPATVPSRLYTLLLLIRDTISVLLRLPFFLFPLVVHLPVYVLAKLGARLAEDEEETQAQNKVAVGLLTMLLVYPASFFFLWAMLWYTPAGAMFSFATVALFANYHNQMINANYESAKRLIAAWRVLVGVWTPKRYELSLSALSQYTTPVVPKENEWIDKKPSPSPQDGGLPPIKTDPVASPVKKETETPLEEQDHGYVLPPTPGIGQDHEPLASSSISPKPASSTLRGKKDKKDNASKKRRPSTRRIMRHVLRTRVEAIKALAAFFDQLAQRPHRISAAPHLAQLHGQLKPAPISKDGAGGEDSALRGTRESGEVIGYLKMRGAKIPTMRGTSAGRVEGEEWLGATSETEASSEVD